MEILREVLDDVIEVSEAEIAGAIRCSPKRCISSPKAQAPRLSPARCICIAASSRQRVGVVLSGGNITSSQLLKILHGEVLAGAQRGSQLAETLADMEYGARSADRDTAARRRHNNEPVHRLRNATWLPILTKC